MRKAPRILAAATAASLLSLAGGCCRNVCNAVPPPAPLGTISDGIWQAQETNAEASDFVIHEHEFIGNTAHLSPAGEQHVKQIAVRVRGGNGMPPAPFPVLIEPSSMSVREGDRYGYPVHNSPELDLERRQFIVHALTTMGVPDAESRVVVSPALTPGFEQFEAEQAYQRGMGSYGAFGFGAFGGFGGFGGFRGVGGFGGFGGGVF